MMLFSFSQRGKLKVIFPLLNCRQILILIFWLWNIVHLLELSKNDSKCGEKESKQQTEALQEDNLPGNIHGRGCNESSISG